MSNYFNMSTSRNIKGLLILGVLYSSILQAQNSLPQLSQELARNFTTQDTVFNSSIPCRNMDKISGGSRNKCKPVIVVNTVIKTGLNGGNVARAIPEKTAINQIRFAIKFLSICYLFVDTHQGLNARTWKDSRLPIARDRCRSWNSTRCRHAKEFNAC